MCQVLFQMHSRNLQFVPGVFAMQTSKMHYVMIFNPDYSTLTTLLVFRLTTVRYIGTFS